MKINNTKEPEPDAAKKAILNKVMRAADSIQISMYAMYGLLGRKPTACKCRWKCLIRIAMNMAALMLNVNAKTDII